MKFGYARVSTGEQTHQLQEDALWAAGCERLFHDTCSGSVASADRPTLQELAQLLRSGDVLWSGG